MERSVWMWMHPALGELVRIMYLFRILCTYQVSVIPKPGEITKDNLEGSQIRFLSVAMKGLAIFEMTASLLLFMPVIEDRSKVPKTSVLLSKSGKLSEKEVGSKGDIDRLGIDQAEEAQRFRQDDGCVHTEMHRTAMEQHASRVI
jgi:hypothetical protein